MQGGPKAFGITPGRNSPAHIPSFLTKLRVNPVSVLEEPIRSLGEATCQRTRKQSRGLKITTAVPIQVELANMFNSISSRDELGMIASVRNE